MIHVCTLVLKQQNLKKNCVQSGNGTKTAELWSSMSYHWLDSVYVPFLVQAVNFFLALWMWPPESLLWLVFFYEWSCMFFFFWHQASCGIIFFTTSWTDFLTEDTIASPPCRPWLYLSVSHCYREKVIKCFLGFFFPNLHFTQNYSDLYLGKVFLSLPLCLPCPQVDRMHLSILIISFYGGQPFMLIDN